MYNWYKLQISFWSPLFFVITYNPISVLTLYDIILIGILQNAYLLNISS